MCRYDMVLRRRVEEMQMQLHGEDECSGTARRSIRTLAHGSRQSVLLAHGRRPRTQRNEQGSCSASPLIDIALDSILARGPTVCLKIFSEVAIHSKDMR